MSATNRLRLYGVLLVLTLLSMGYLYQCHRSAMETDGVGQASMRDYAEIQAEGKLRMLAPYSAFAAGDSTGYVYELSRLIQTRTGLEVEIHLEDNVDKSMMLLREGAVDLIAHPIVRTADTDTTEYTWIYGRTSGPVYLVQRRDSAGMVRRQLDLSGATITLPQGSPLALFVKHLADEIGETIHVHEDPLYETEQLLMLVSTGQLDYTACSEAERDLYHALHPELDFSLPLSHRLRRGWLLRHGAKQLADSLRTWLADSDSV